MKERYDGGELKIVEYYKDVVIGSEIKKNILSMLDLYEIMIK